MKALFSLALIGVSLAHIPPLFLTEEAVVERIATHLIIEDKEAAYQELRSALALYPDSARLKQLFIEVASNRGRINEALLVFKDLKEFSALTASNRHTLGELAWGILVQGEESQKVDVRITALLGASFTHDLRGAQAVFRALESTNALVRALAVQFATNYRDDLLCLKLIELLQHEKSPLVLSRVVSAIGQLKLAASIPYLEILLENPQTGAELKAQIFQALALMNEEIDPLALRKLLLSDRAFMRGLGCEIIAHLNLYEEAASLVASLGDASLMVRVQALSALISFPNHILAPYIDSILAKVDNTHTILRLMGASLALRLDHSAGRKLFDEAFSNNIETQRLACGILSRSGPQAAPLMLTALDTVKDPFARVTLALGLIGQRCAVDRSCDILCDFLQRREEKIMFDFRPHPLFSRIVPSEVHHTPALARYPEFVDHRTRLELLSLLSTLRHPRAEEAIKGFLRKGHWSVGASAMALLLEEGSVQSIDVISQFLEDSDPKLRLGAALALAFVGKDPRAAEVLCALYPEEDRDTKLTILEALTSMGSDRALPLFIRALEEPSHVLKIAAASGIIQSLSR